MKIRKAEKKDIPRILALLGQVLQIHAELRPDIFIPGTTKYTPCELAEHPYDSYISSLLSLTFLCKGIIGSPLRYRYICHPIAVLCLHIIHSDVHSQ